jgi:hypothetical protein
MNGREIGLIPVAVRCAFYSHMIVGIAGLNPAEGMDVRHLCLVCVV